MKTEQVPGRFQKRAFATLVVAFSAIGLPVTGIANHIYGFSPMTVARHAWMTAHNVLGLLFVVFSIWHVVLNRRALWAHLVRAGARLPSVRREAAWASALVVALVLLFTGHAFVAGG